MSNFKSLSVYLSLFPKLSSKEKMTRNKKSSKSGTPWHHSLLPLRSVPKRWQLPLESQQTPTESFHGQKPLQDFFQLREVCQFGKKRRMITAFSKNFAWRLKSISTSPSIFLGALSSYPQVQYQDDFPKLLTVGSSDIRCILFPLKSSHVPWERNHFERNLHLPSVDFTGIWRWIPDTSTDS